MPGQMEGQKDRWTDRKTDRPYFIVPFRLPPGVQKGSKLKHAVFNLLYRANKRGNKI